MIKRFFLQVSSPFGFGVDSIPGNAAATIRNNLIKFKN